jgi:hypothetical protein
MLTLILREIEDNWVFLLAAALLACVFSFLIGWQMYSVNGNNEGAITIVLGVNAVAGIFVFCGLGASQMYWDRMKKISSLLTTVPVTRNQIFTARVVTGLITVVIGFIPTVVTVEVITNLIEQSSTNNLPPVYGMTAGLWLPILLFCFASYFIGLQAGWTSNKIMPTLGGILLSLILSCVILIKGFELQAYLILVPFIVCCIYRAWHKYSTAAL